MRLLTLNHMQNAYQSLRSNRLRTLLTMLGVTIGVASVVAILALSSGAGKIVSDQVDALGGNIAVIRPGSSVSTDVTSLSQIQVPHTYTASTLSQYDVSSLSSINHLDKLAPLMVLSGAVKGDTTAPTGTSIVATTPELARVSNLQIREGQFLDPTLDANTAVIGAQLSVNLFGTEESIGKSVSVRGLSFTIVGILKRMNDPINYNNVDFDNAILINEQSGISINQGAAQIQQIDIKSDSVANLEQVKIDITKTLLKNHLGETDFTVLSGSQIAQPTNQLFYAIAGATSAIAGISLLVGGIGIMNIMLVNVAERTREIGIRKALGASNGDIMAQFLIESIGLSIGGGILGYIFGYLTAFLISTFVTFDPIFTWQIAVIALGLSLFIGTLFGLYPAIRAARKDPIEALRQYE